MSVTRLAARCLAARSLAARCLAACVLLATGAMANAADLTPTETRWLQGAWPVIAHAKQLGLPLDIVVQPQDAPDAAPLALAYVDGRCKLVLSMRGNPQAERTLAALPDAIRDDALELMAAHELGHCRRYLDGAWHGMPAGFAPAAPPAGLRADLRAAYEDMSAARREEAYGDLVGLAWIVQRHPDHYAALQRWLLDERSAERDAPGSHHDTVHWVRLAAEPAALRAGSIFDAAHALWQRGLQSLPAPAAD